MSVPVHAEAAPEGRHRLALNRLGLWMFIVSESFLFSAVIASRFYLLGSERPEELNQPLGLAISFVLLSSSFTAYRGETYAAFGDRRWLRWIAATMGLGLLFLVGVVLEWEEGLRSFPPSTPYGSAFFSLIGLHAFHVLTGLVVLALVWRLGRRGRVGAANHWPIEAAVKYWHFVDVAWVFIFPTVYLVR
ncbi:MAG TPA: heme-copper oxidase subunit III [Actinomycetota bacterium]|nr:heme-copper oxidase subunit III [Actinomycetota bacterium]